MLISAPVYTMQNDTHFVNIYSELEDGTFKRTQDEPLRLLRDDIAGISMTQGELVSSYYDRADRRWSTATVSYHYGNPQSFFQFLRDNIARKRFFVFSMPVLSGHLYKFNVHQLKLKNSISQRKISLLKEKYTEAIGLWSEAEYSEHLLKTDMGSTNAGIQTFGELPDFRVYGRKTYKDPAAAEAQSVTRLVHSGSETELSDTHQQFHSENEVSTAPFSADEPVESVAKEITPVGRLHFLRRFVFHRT